VLVVIDRFQRHANFIGALFITQSEMSLDIAYRRTAEQNKNKTSATSSTDRDMKDKDVGST
jgi:hypothetical protein